MLHWPFQAMNRAKLTITLQVPLAVVRFVLLLEKAKWLKRELFLRPFADALAGGPQQVSCVESALRF